MALIEVSDFSIQLQTHRGPARAVRNVSFQIERGQALGLIGESGCGKSITAMALMGLLPESAQVSGHAQFDGQNLINQTDRWWRQVRGNRIGMIFQEPMTALNPVQTIGQQISEPLRLHKGMSRAQAKAEAIALLDRVGIAQPAQRYDAYPHQFSGGQRQRITIAMALACGPDLLIADEPTTALDVTVQKQILELMQELVAEHSMALLLISHDLGVIAQNVEQLLVMYGGTVVEQGLTEAVFAHRAHPYTRGLFAARPQLQASAGTGLNHQPRHLPTIAGSVPDLVDLPAGCPFAGRCSYTQPPCYIDKPMPQLLERELRAAPLALRSWTQPHEVRCLIPEAYATNSANLVDSQRPA